MLIGLFWFGFDRIVVGFDSVLIGFWLDVDAIVVGLVKVLICFSFGFIGVS